MREAHESGSLFCCEVVVNCYRLDIHCYTDVTLIVTHECYNVTMLKKTNGETLTFRHATDCKYPLSNTPLQM